MEVAMRTGTGGEKSVSRIFECSSVAFCVCLCVCVCLSVCLSVFVYCLSVVCVNKVIQKLFYIFVCIEKSTRPPLAILPFSRCFLNSFP